MSRTFLSALCYVCFALVFAVAASLLVLAIARESAACRKGAAPPPPREEQCPEFSPVQVRWPGCERPCQRPRTPSAREDADDRPIDSGRTVPGLPLAHVTILIHGVNDDGKGWSLRFKEALAEGRTADAAGRVYLFRWTQPDGGVPDLGHARNSLKAVEQRFPDHPESEAGYQIAVAERLRDFLAGARALYAEYGVDGRIDVVAHSQGTLITLKALDLGGQADNVLFLGSPLLYACDRQDDVIEALPHVRGVLYNYYTRSDLPVRLMGGGLFLAEPCGWPTKDLPAGKVVQTRLNVDGHTGYYTPEAIRANYVDKVGAQPGELPPPAPDGAEAFAAKWRTLTASAGLIDPE